jgi:hypothetical protein
MAKRRLGVMALKRSNDRRSSDVLNVISFDELIDSFRSSRLHAPRPVMFQVHWYFLDGLAVPLPFPSDKPLDKTVVEIQIVITSLRAIFYDGTWATLPEEPDCEFEGWVLRYPAREKLWVCGVTSVDRDPGEAETYTSLHRLKPREALGTDRSIPPR